MDCILILPLSVVVAHYVTNRSCLRDVSDVAYVDYSA